jgi:putative tryptophan/tyrosine transport system substrate-binding protein
MLFLVLCLTSLTETASAEDRIWRLGVLTPFDWAADTTMHSVMLPELARRGFVDGRNLIVLPRWGSNADLDQLARLAQDLAAAKPDVIIAVGPNAIKAAMKASPRTPIVASFSPDPVKEGVAASLSRPGGEVTGIAMLAMEGDVKRIELLHDAIPTARKFGMLVDSLGVARQSEMQRAAQKAGVEVVFYAANSAADYGPALDAMRAAGVGGVVIQSSPVFHRDAVQLAALATDRRLPTICEWRSMATDGCVFGYGPDIGELRLRTADFIVRLFAGGNPAEMPFEQPTRFEMAINNKIAHAIGVTVPPSLYVRADEVIE